MGRAIALAARSELTPQALHVEFDGSPVWGSSEGRGARGGGELCEDLFRG